MQMLLKTVHINVCITSLNAFLWECRQKLCKYVRLPFHTRHYCCHVMAPHSVAHTAGPSFLLPSTPTGSETGRQQQAQLNSDFEFWVDGTPLVRQHYSVRATLSTLDRQCVVLLKHVPKMTDQQIKDKRPRWLFQGQIDHKWIQSSNLTRSEI